jgi:hypothetical protein
MAKTTLTLDIEYDPELTDPEGLACAADRLLETVLSTPGIMDEYGAPRFGEFFVAQTVTTPEVAMDERRRWVLYSLDTDELLTTRTFDSYQDAADEASELNDVLVLPLIVRGITV